MGTPSARNVDQAALLGVALAATVSISAAEGPWEPIETVVGLVLISVVAAYYDFSTSLREWSWARSAALASVIALCWCLTVAWPLQSVGLNPYWWLPIVWILTAGAVLGWLWRRRHGRRSRLSVPPVGVGQAEKPRRSGD